MSERLRFGGWLSLALTAALMSGCETFVPDTGDTYDPIRAAFEGEPGFEAAEEAGEKPAPPESVQEALLPPITIDPSPGKRGVQRFDVTVSDAPAREFFMSLVEDTDQNIVLHPDVEGDLTLALKNVTIKEVLDAARDVYGYEYNVMPWGYRILPRGLTTKIFEVDYINLSRTSNSQTQVIAGGQISAAEGAGLSGSGSSIVTDAEWDFWVDIEAAVEVLIGTDEGRSIITNPSSGMVIVTAMPEELNRVEEFLYSLADNVERQVVLEAKILEVVLSDAFQAGINWEILGQLGGNGKEILVSQTSGDALGTPLSPDQATGLGGNAGTSGLLDSQSGSVTGGFGVFDQFGGILTAAIAANDFTALIELLETQGTVKTLSSPRIATMNNQTAVIKVGSDEYFVTEVSNSNTSSGGATTNNPEITLTPFFSGVALAVTPQISGDGNITLHVHPSISEVTDQNKAINVGSITSLPLAFSTIRESDSVIRTRSGELVALGGLMEDDTRDATASTPWVSRLPWIGSLFRQIIGSYNKTELVILLRATVVEGTNWGPVIRETGERLRRIDRGLPAWAGSEAKDAPASPKR